MIRVSRVFERRGDLMSNEGSAVVDMSVSRKKCSGSKICFDPLQQRVSGEA